MSGLNDASGVTVGKDVLQPVRHLMWRMAAGETTAVDRILAPVSRLLWRIGFRFDFVGGFTLGGVKDGALYRPTFAPWARPSWRQALRIGDRRSLVSPERRYFLVQMLRQTLRGTSGSIVECGVYRGGTAYLLADVISQESPGRKLLLFDSFTGMPETDTARDIHQAGDFADTELADVRHYLRDFPNVGFHAGHIPEAFADVPEDSYAFVHVDLDIYAAVRDATAYFYARLEAGGTIVYDDYGLRSCPGARQAVDEFFFDKPEVPIVLSSGHCLVLKLDNAG